MECSLLPGCKPEDKQECEIKDVIVTVQVPKEHCSIQPKLSCRPHHRLVAELKPRQVCSMVMSCQMEEQRKQKEFNGFDEIPGKGDQIESDQLETIHEEKNNKAQRTHF